AEPIHQCGPLLHFDDPEAGHPDSRSDLALSPPRSPPPQVADLTDLQLADLLARDFGSPPPGLPVAVTVRANAQLRRGLDLGEALPPPPDHESFASGEPEI